MMDNTNDMLREAVARLLGDGTSATQTMQLESVGLDAKLWAGFQELGLRGDDLGVGLDAKMIVLQEVGRAGALVPYAESEVLARWLAAAAGLQLGDATSTIVAQVIDAAPPAGGAASLNLQGVSIAWGRHATRVLVPCKVAGRSFVADIEPAALELRAEANIAGEPRDVVQAQSLSVPASKLHPVTDVAAFDRLSSLGALCRTAAIVGALATSLELAVQYAQDRKQFGKSLSQFQIIQSYLAEMAAEVCAAGVAHDLGVGGATRDDGWGDVAVAKVRAGQAANTVAKLAHQIHGAIGMTQEYPLHVWTRRLWAWREEYGNELFWGRALGRSLVEGGEDSFWPRMTSASFRMASEQRGSAE